MNTQNLKNKIIQLLKDKNLSVQKAKALGFETFITHHRYKRLSSDDGQEEGLMLIPLYDFDKDERTYNLSPKGGMTHVEIVDHETRKEASATAECSLYDAYERSVGIKYGLSRALRAMLDDIRQTS